MGTARPLHHPCFCCCALAGDEKLAGQCVTLVILYPREIEKSSPQHPCLYTPPAGSSSPTQVQVSSASSVLSVVCHHPRFCCCVCVAGRRNGQCAAPSSLTALTCRDQWLFGVASICYFFGLWVAKVHCSALSSNRLRQRERSFLKGALLALSECKMQCQPLPEFVASWS